MSARGAGSCRTGPAHRSWRLAALVCLACAGRPAAAEEVLQARTRAILLSAPAWTVHWSPPDEIRAYVAIVRFRLEDGGLVAASAHPDGSRCYPDIRVRLQGDGFLFHGCTGVPKEMRHDPADPEAPFKGRAFGFSYRWTRSE